MTPDALTDEYARSVKNEDCVAGFYDGATRMRARLLALLPDGKPELFSDSNWQTAMKRGCNAYRAAVLEKFNA